MGRMEMGLPFLPLLCFFLLLLQGSVFSSSNGDGFSLHSSAIATSALQRVDWRGSSTRPGGRSLKSIAHSEDSMELVALLNGTIYLEDSSSGQVFWSFSSGSPIYSSYQAPFKQDSTDTENASSAPTTSFFIDYGDDWQLYAHSRYSAGMKLSMNIEDFIKITPHISEDGAVILGSKKTKVFVVEAKTGKLVRTYTSPDSPSTLHTDGGGNTSHNGGKNNKDVVLSGLSDAAQVIYITRTDYALQTFGPNSDKVSWSMKAAAIEAACLCKDVDAPTASLNASYEVDSELGADFDKPLACQSKRMVVRRQNKAQSSSGAIHSDEKLPLPDPNSVDEQLHDHHETMMLPGSTPNPAIPLQPKIDKLSIFSHPNNEAKAVLALPNDPAGIDEQDVVMPYTYNNMLSMLLKSFTAFPVILVITVILFGIVFFHSAVSSNRKVASDGQFGTSVKASPSKRKKSRKAGTYDGRVETNATSSENGDGIAPSENSNKQLLDLNKFVDCGASGHRIGKLLVSNIEIAKGSNGTIVLEGVYEGRQVAVKRLVQAHHDVAFKEIQNLIASDRHPNIVRWYGVEYDKDFVYLSLERCTCSFDDVIQICSDYSLNPAFNNDQVSKSAIEYKLRLDSVKDIMQDLNFWKANGLPSTLLIKLMRDMVSGLAHLHELGIIHRDLKPQNVLIVKERSLCAKLSDMGISKRLVGNMSSLGHHATGSGSSGWQAPEQLLLGRQTRAVDLFSLGCVLFFCVTGGKHPFGDRLERDINIVKNQIDLFLVENIPEVRDLISQLLNPNPDLRPKALEVLYHPMFWSSETRLSFLRDTSDRVELEDRGLGSDLLKALEKIAPIALGGKWDEKMEAAFITNIGHYRRYKFDSVRDLLRVMRNKLNHYRELPREIQELLGPIPEGYDSYFASRFPRLLIEVYRVVFRHCHEEECFQKYFRGISF